MKVEYVVAISLIMMAGLVGFNGQDYMEMNITTDTSYTGGNNTGMVNINWINTTSSSGGGDAEISVESSGNWTAYWGITNTNSAPSFPLWSYTNGWWNASASGGLGTTTGNGDLTWVFQDMDDWGALAPPSCNILMIALFDGNPGSASAQSTPATGDPVSIDYQTFELGNITAVDCNWDNSWVVSNTGGNNTGGNNTGGNNTGGNNTGGNNTGGNNTGGNNTGGNDSVGDGDEADSSILPGFSFLLTFASAVCALAIHRQGRN